MTDSNEEVAEDVKLLDAFYATVPDFHTLLSEGRKTCVAASNPLSPDDLKWLAGIKAAISASGVNEFTEDSGKPTPKNPDLGVVTKPDDQAAIKQAAMIDTYSLISLQTNIMVRIVNQYRKDPVKIAEAFDSTIDPSGNSLGWLRELSNLLPPELEN